MLPRSRFKKIKIVLFLFIVFCFLFLVLVYWGIYIPIGSSNSVLFSVKKGESLDVIASNLQEQGLIRHKSFFSAYAIFKNKTRSLKAGEYELSFSMAVPDILEKISSGDRIRKTITIIEGWGIEDIEDYLEAGPIDPELEGYLFPDTYEIYPQDQLEDIVQKMKDNFEVKIKPFEKEIEQQGKTIEDIIIMASIIEKEVRTIEDKKVVSGILWKRIKSNMPLQVDATISYITGRKSTKITKQELAIDSPYNTYKYKGLPPGPICSPGLDSIKAAIYPVSTKYWFYLSTPEGETIFSTTLKEHEQARKKYL